MPPEHIISVAPRAIASLYLIFSGSHTLGTAGDINISYQGVEGCRKLRLALPLQPSVREKVRKSEVKSGCLKTILTDDFWPFQPALQPARAAVPSSLREHLRGPAPPAAGGVSGGQAGCWGAAPTTAQPGCCRSGELLRGHTAQLGLSSWGRSRGHGLPLAGLDQGSTQAPARPPGAGAIPATCSGMLDPSPSFHFILKTSMHILGS